MARMARRVRTRGAAARVPPGTSTPEPTKDPELFLAQARWLLEFHNRRSDAFAARAVAILGFSGVILALLPRALDIKEAIEMTAGVKIALVVTTTALLATVVSCLGVLAPRNAWAPSVESLRSLWRMHLKGKRSGKVSRDLAESMLHGTSVIASSPIDSAYKEARGRGAWFKRSVQFLAIAIAGLAALIVQIYWQAGG